MFAPGTKVIVDGEIAEVEKSAGSDDYIVRLRSGKHAGERRAVNARYMQRTTAASTGAAPEATTKAAGEAPAHQPEGDGPREGAGQAPSGTPDKASETPTNGGSEPESGAPDSEEVESAGEEKPAASEPDKAPATDPDPVTTTPTRTEER